MAHIQTPVKGFTGIVAGVSFANGVGTSDDPAALAYFERHGYDVMPHAPKPSKTPAKGTSKSPLPKSAEPSKTPTEGDADKEQA